MICNGCILAIANSVSSSFHHIQSYLYILILLILKALLNGSLPNNTIAPFGFDDSFNCSHIGSERNNCIPRTFCRSIWRICNNTIHRSIRNTFHSFQTILVEYLVYHTTSNQIANKCHTFCLTFSHVRIVLNLCSPVDVCMLTAHIYVLVPSVSVPVSVHCYGVSVLFGRFTLIY